jgi:hypothetical protein
MPQVQKFRGNFGETSVQQHQSSVRKFELEAHLSFHVLVEKFGREVYRSFHEEV